MAAPARSYGETGRSRSIRNRHASIWMRAGCFYRRAVFTKPRHWPGALVLNPEMTEASACMARALLYAGDDRALDAIGPMLTADARQSVARLPPGQAMPHARL